MRRDRTGSASAARDAGLRRVTRLTWQLAVAGAACSALIAAAFGYGTSISHAASVSHPASTPRSGPHAQQGRRGQAGRHPPKHHRQDGSGSGSGLQIPAQPPAPAPGAGQVTSGAS
jgi:hypothetical protein